MSEQDEAAEAKKPEVGVEQHPDGAKYLTVKCPDCDQMTRYPFEGLSPGIRLECSCGVGFNFSQENYDALKRAFGLGETDDATH